MTRRSENAPRRINAARRYAKTGSFDRLAGRPTAPGSDVPRHYYLKRRIVCAVVVCLLLLPGLLALFS